jgi:hypothetical protein
VVHLCAIRTLWEMLGENLVFLALERANGHVWQKVFHELQQQIADDPFADTTSLLVYNTLLSTSLERENRKLLLLDLQADCFRN